MTTGVKTTKKKQAKTSEVAKPLTKSGFCAAIASDLQFDRKTVAAVLNGVEKLVVEQLAKVGLVTVPGVARLKTTRKPATPERDGVNPFTKEPMVVKAKPESVVVKAQVVKALRDAVAS